MVRKGVRRFLSAPSKRHRHYGPAKRRRRLREEVMAGPTSSENHCQRMELSPSEGFLGFDIHSPLTAFRPTQQRPTERVRVLSLFDGIGAARLALQRLSLDVEKYWSSEVDPQCLRVLKENHTDILHIGDVRDLNTDIIASMRTVSFLCGGSPCNEVSRVNGGRRGLFDEEGDSNLFFHFVRILKQLQAAAVARESRFYFFFENTAHLDAVTLEAFTKELGCKPIVRFAAHYSATKRKRLFWSNLPGFHDKELPMKNNRVLQDYIGPARKALVQVAKTFTTNRGGQRRSNGELHVEFEGQQEFLYAADQERLLGFPDGYTDKGGMSQTARSALLGRTWSVDVVMDLWTPLCEIFRGTG